MVLANMRMINLSLDELRLIAQIRKISEYKNKSKEDLIKALSGSEPKPDPKPEPKPKPDLKLEPKPEPKTKLKLKPEPKIKIKVIRKKLEKNRKDFD